MRNLLRLLDNACTGKHNMSMNKLSKERRAQIVGCLIEGMSIRATCRLTGAAKGTVLKLLEDLGKACAEYQDKALVNLKSRRIQCDEIWQFVGMKQKTAKRQGRQNEHGVGDVWTWTAIDADTKLIPCWFVGGRDAGAAYELMSELQHRLTHRVQLTTDGHRAYLEAVESTFGIDIDYAMLVKIYGEDPSVEKRYSPAVCLGTERHVVSGNPDPDHISTSYVERQNLSMRMHMRRFTRLTNAFSKKLENLCYMLALYFMFYNFARIHQTLRVTPAMEAGVADHVWSIEEILTLLPKENVVILK